MTTTSDPDVQELSRGLTGGWRAGATTSDKGGFFGATPVVQPSITAVTTATATTALNETKIDRLYTALRTLGLINTGG